MEFLKRVCEESCLVSSESAAIFPYQSRIHTRRGFYPGLWPGLIPLLILHFELCVEVSPLCSPPTTVCEVADSVVCQVAMLPSFNSL